MKLSQVLKEKSHTMNSFSKASDIPYTTIKNINQRGIDNASIKVIYKIAHVLDMTADELYERLKK